MIQLTSIRSKLFAVVFFAGVLIAVVVNVAVANTVSRSAREALRGRAQAEAILLAESVGPYVEFEQSDEAQSALGHAREDRLVVWAAIYDPSGGKVGDGLNQTHSPASRIPEDSDDGVDYGWAVAAFAPIDSEAMADNLGYVGVALSTADVERQLDETRTQSALFTLVALLVGLLLAIWLANRIIRPLEAVTAGAKRIAEGDISFDMDLPDTNDEVGDLAQAFRTMTARLRDLARRIHRGSEELAGAAAGMFSEVREQEALATQQTASLEEIRRTLELLSTSADQVTTDAETVRSMATRNLESSREIADRTRLVSEHSERIGEILSLIQSIADKSDLLALNASLEGTKAGEVGRGFSLVAAEMRRLSEHVMDSVRDIRKLIADTREASHASVLATEEGIKLSGETMTAANKISDAVGKQQNGTSQVKASADEIVRAINETLKGRAEATRSAEGLLQLSQDLREAAASFRLAPDATDG